MFGKAKKVLTLLLLAAILTGCGGGTVETDVSSAHPESANPEVPETEGETEEADPVADRDFNGASFRITTSESGTQHYVFTLTELTGDVLNDALYNRTKAIEDKFNIVFAADNVESDAFAAADTFINAVHAGDTTYDLAMLLERRAFTMAQEGCFTDVKTLPEVHPDRVWWLTDVNDTINFGDARYITYGSANLGFYDLTHVLLFNKSMAEDLGLADPYELVLSGAWTFDRFAEMARAAIRDINGDGAFGKEDSYGYVGGSNMLLMNFVTAARSRTIERTADGAKIALLTDTRIADVCEKVANTVWETGFWYTKSQSSNNYYLTDTYFQDDQALFADHTFYSACLLRDMASDFGIIPFPKYEEAQERYGSVAEAGSRITTVPAVVRDPELVGAVLEMMHYLSYRDVMPAYYETTLKQKVSRDSVSAQMLDLILGNIYYDLGATMFNDAIKDGILAPYLMGSRTDYASRVEKKLPAIEKAITDAGGVVAQ